MGAAALRVFSGDTPSPSSQPASLTDRALVVLGYLRTIAADRIDVSVPASLTTLAAVSGMTCTRTRRALMELNRLKAISWDRDEAAFALLPGSLSHVRTVPAHRACAPCDVRTVPACDAGASEDHAGLGMAQAPCVPPVPSSFVQEGKDGGTRAPAREAIQPDLPFPKPNLNDPELAKVADMAMNLAGDVSWGMFVDQMATIGYSAEWIRSAIERGVSRNRLRRDYIHGVLQGYQREGGPDQKATNAPVRRKPPRIEYLVATPEDVHPSRRKGGVS